MNSHGMRGTNRCMGMEAYLIRQTVLWTYKKLEGDVVFDGVDFGYNDEKIVLHDM